MRRLSVYLMGALILSGLVLSGCPTRPELSVSTSALHFGTMESSTLPGELEYQTELTFEVWNSGCDDTPLVFSVNANQGWISVNPSAEQSAGEDDKVTITVTIDRDYSAKALAFASGIITVESSIGSAQIAVTTAPNYFTETFAGATDLLGKSLVFEPNGGLSYYGLTTEDLGDAFPTDPAGGLLLDFADLGDPIAARPFGDAETVPFYGVNYDTLYISSEGWISFGEPGNSPDSLGNHFRIPQISLFPLDATLPGSMVSYLQDDEKLVITYENAPTPGAPASPNDVQIELYFNGKMTLNYLDVDPAASGVIGLSVGNQQGGQPSDFIESDLNTAPLKVALD